MKPIESDPSSCEPSEVELTVARYSFREALTKGKNYVDLVAIGASSTANSIMAASNPWATVFLTAAVLSLLYVNESRYLRQNEKSLNQYREALDLEQVDGSRYRLSYLGLLISGFFAVVCLALGIADNISGQIPDWPIILSTVLATGIAPIARKINVGIIANEVRLVKEVCRERGLPIALKKTELVKRFEEKERELNYLNTLKLGLEGVLEKKESEIKKLNEMLEKKEEKSEELSEKNACEIVEIHSDVDETTGNSSPHSFFYHNDNANSDKTSDVDDDAYFNKESFSLSND
jgi:hypothetical protein